MPGNKSQPPFFQEIDLDTLRLIGSYKRFFHFLRFAARGLGLIPGITKAITLIGTLIHPNKVAPVYSQSWKQGSWIRYLKTTCFATALLYRIKDFEKIIRIQWHDPDDVLLSSKISGGLILSYHHPFAYHLPAFIGANGIKIEALALSPEESPLYPLYKEYVANWFIDSEFFFGGGKWRFLYKKYNHMRVLLTALREGKVVYSLNDFPNIYPGARTQAVQLAGKDFLVPEGLIGSAVKMKLPISVAYVDWLGGYDFLIRISSLNSCGRDHISSSEIMDKYFKILNELVVKRPEFWEAWGSI